MSKPDKKTRVKEQSEKKSDNSFYTWFWEGASTFVTSAAVGDLSRLLKDTKPSQTQELNEKYSSRPISGVKGQWNILSPRTKKASS